jgi:hypothetical protein
VTDDGFCNTKHVQKGARPSRRGGINSARFQIGYCLIKEAGYVLAGVLQTERERAVAAARINGNKHGNLAVLGIQRQGILLGSQKPRIGCWDSRASRKSSRASSIDSDRICSLSSKCGDPGCSRKARQAKNLIQARIVKYKLCKPTALIVRPFSSASFGDIEIAAAGC